MTFDELIKEYEGKGVDWDGSYGYQCYDLAHAYAVKVVGINIPSLPAAKDLWTKTITGYDKIKNDPTAVPLKGDIVVWGTEIGVYGHVAIFIDGNVNTFTSFDQNFPINSLCHKQSHNYKGVLGWFHPKTTVSDAISVPKKDFENLVRKSTAYDGICDYLKFDKSSTDSAKLISAFENLKSDLSKSNKSLAEVEEKLTTCLNQQADSNPTDISEPIPDDSNSGGDAGTVEDNPDVPSGDTNNPPNGADIAGFTIPQINEAVGKVLHSIKTFFNNILGWFWR